jgi:hypothetical protein
MRLASALSNVAALLLLLAFVNGPRPSFQTVQHFDLAFLTHKLAWELNGQRIGCRVAGK